LTEQWAEKQIQLLESIYEKITGNKVQYRDSDLRQGGPYNQHENNKENTGSFLASEQQLLRLKENKYLVVESSPYTSPPYENDNSTFLVSYFCPSISHLNPSLIASFPLAIEFDVEDFITKKDNCSLMKLLLSNIFVDIYNKEFSKIKYSLLRTLISLSPFVGSLLLNEQIIKFYFYLIQPNWKFVQFHIFSLSPYNELFSLLSSDSQLQHHQDQMMKFKGSLLNTIATRLADPTNQRTMIELQSSIGWYQFINDSFQNVENNNSKFNWFLFSLTESHYQLIKQKKELELFDQLFGKTYNYRIY
jgi:hypothetical protein